MSLDARMPPLALLAGGLATRLRPLTETIPKAMIEVAGEPFIAHQLRLLRRQSVDRVILCVGHFAEAIEAFVGDGHAFGLAVAYSSDGPVLLGTGGALRKALPMLGEQFLIMYGDSYLDVPFRPLVERFAAARRLGLMAVYRNQNRWDKSNVAFDGDLVRRYDKRAPSGDMAYIDYGLGMLKAEVLQARPAEVAFDLAEVYGDLTRRGELSGYEVVKRFYEIGSHDGLVETDRMLKERTSP